MQLDFWSKTLSELNLPEIFLFLFSDVISGAGCVQDLIVWVVQLTSIRLIPLF